MNSARKVDITAPASSTWLRKLSSLPTTRGEVGSVLTLFARVLGVHVTLATSGGSASGFSAWETDCNDAIVKFYSTVLCVPFVEWLSDGHLHLLFGPWQWTTIFPTVAGMYVLMFVRSWCEWNYQLQRTVPGWHSGCDLWPLWWSQSSTRFHHVDEIHAVVERKEGRETWSFVGRSGAQG